MRDSNVCLYCCYYYLLFGCNKDEKKAKYNMEFAREEKKKKDECYYFD